MLHTAHIQQHNMNPFTNLSCSTPMDLTSSSILPVPPEAACVHQYVWAIGGPIILLVGLIGNVLIIVVMGHKTLGGTSASIYLRLMAAADFVALVAGIVPEWLEITFAWKFKEIDPATCKLEKFLFYTSADTSIWILVIFTVERVFAVCCPLESKERCLPNRSKLLSLGALSLAVTKNTHVFWTRGAIFEKSGDTTSGLVSNCGRGGTANFAYFENYVRPWLVLALVDAIPFIIILVCNVFIIRGLVRIQHESHVMRTSSASGRQLVQVSTTCISASFCFLICITPTMVLLIGRPWWSAYSQSDCVYKDAKALSNLFVYVHHSVNFFLYCLTGSRFRTTLVRLMKQAKDTMVRPCACWS